MKNGAFWLSWWLISLTASLYIASSLTLLSNLARWKAITNIPSPIFFAYIFLSTIGMNTLGFLLSTVSRSTETGFSISYSVLLLSFVFQVFLTNPVSILVFYGEGPLFSTFRFIESIVCFYPGYNYVKLWSDLINISGSHFDPNLKLFKKGRPFTYADLFVRDTGSLGLSLTYLKKSPFDTGMELIRNITLMMLAAWYLDLIIAKNRGYLFFIGDAYNYVLGLFLGGGEALA